jgi:hypothetical protein
MADQVVVRGINAWKNERDDLTTKRNALFNRYSRKPTDLQLATEIKTIDDAIAKCTEKITQEILSQYKSKSLADASKS